MPKNLLLTKADKTALIRNYHALLSNSDHDPVPVVKLFTPWSSATWLLTELEPDSSRAFGLCDLGQGFPELGYVDVDEIAWIRGPGGLKIERDRHFYPDKPVSAYANDARRSGYISA